MATDRAGVLKRGTMTAVFLLLAFLTLFGLLLLSLGAITLASPGWSEPSAVPPCDEEGFTPPISVLKPLRGVDGALEENLESFCRLDYPQFEILFAIGDPADPAVEVARRVRDRHPGLPIRILTGKDGSSINQKVAALIPAWEEARHPFRLISDSNIRVEPAYLRETAAHAADPRVGLVTNLIRGAGGRGIGAWLENLHLNGFVMPSVAFLDRFLGMPLAVGKSMLVRREALEGIGGLPAFREILAEDYIMGRNLSRAGWRVPLCHHQVTNVTAGWTAGAFLSRHLRWGKLRRRIGPLTYLAEPLATPILPALAAWPFAPPPWGSLLVALTAAATVLLHLIAGRLARSDLPLAAYLLAPAKDLLMGLAWFLPFFSRTVEWRGTTYRVGKDSRLETLPRRG